MLFAGGNATYTGSGERETGTGTRTRTNAREKLSGKNILSFQWRTYLLGRGGRNTKQWRIQDFPEGGAWTLQGGREHAKFSWKLHEIERIWTPRGGRASLTPPPRSANAKHNATLGGWPSNSSSPSWSLWFGPIDSSSGSMCLRGRLHSQTSHNFHGMISEELIFLLWLRKRSWPCCILIN